VPFDDKRPGQMVKRLMTRSAKHENGRLDGVGAVP
jgi:hypothetical protein